MTHKKGFATSRVIRVSRYRILHYHETGTVFPSYVTKVLLLPIIFSSLQSCELMELGCLCVCACLRGWTSLINSHMHPLLRTINAVRDFFSSDFRIEKRLKFRP